MSGILKNGVQWEHCNECGKWVPIQDLKSGYSNKWDQIADLCSECYEKVPFILRSTQD